MKRIGEILVERGWVDAAVCLRALAKQREFPRRLCSLLIAGGVLEVDQASRALGEQHGVPAVLQKHLDHRDLSLAALIPAELARAWWVLPIGRMGNGDLIVCARDPQPSVLAALMAVVGETIVLAVAPASQIETLVVETYGAPDEDFDVDLSTGPIVSLDLDPMPDDEMAEDPMGGLGSLELVELDDDGVTRDLTQSGMIQTGAQYPNTLPPSSAGIRVPTLPPANVSAPPQQPPAEPAQARATSESELPAMIRDTPPPQAAPPPHATPPPQPTPPPVPKRRGDPEAIAAAYAVAPPKFDPSTIAVGTEPPRRKFLAISVNLPDTFTALSSALTRDAATAAAMRFASGRWRAALLLTVKEKTALGAAGHGNLLTEDVVAGLAIPLGVPSIVSSALAANALTIEPPSDTSPVQDRLDRLLGMPRFPAAIPIQVADRREFVFVIGDPTTDDTDAATADLGQLAHALGSAYARLAT